MMRLSLRGKITSVSVYVHTSSAIFSDSGVKASLLKSIQSWRFIPIFPYSSVTFSVLQSYNIQCQFALILPIRLRQPACPEGAMVPF